jgi:hypothetical protein
MKQRENIILNYIKAYNEFDMDGMVADFDESIRFENISNGKSIMTLFGLTAFKAQAERAIDVFSARQQTVKAFHHSGDQTEIEIDYEATLAVDFPNGLKKGRRLKLLGKSIFKFSGEKIVELIDIS